MSSPTRELPLPEKLPACEETPPPFPKDVEVVTSTSTTTIPHAEAEHRRLIQMCTSLTLLFVLVAVSGAAGYLIFRIALRGTPEEQKLAFGAIGVILGVLWSNFGKLGDWISKR